MFAKPTRYLVRKLFRRSHKSLTAAPKLSKLQQFRKQTKRWFQKLVGFDASKWGVESFDTASRRLKLTYRDYINPIQWLKWIFSFAWSWLLSRKFSQMSGAIPALVVGTVFLGLLAFAFVADPATRLTSYRGMFDAALDARDYPAALTTIGALIDDSPDSADLQYQQAIVLDLSDARELAIEGMTKLADQYQHALAALWMISKTCDLTQLASWDESQHEQFRKWMDVVLPGVEGENLLASKTLMASYLVGIGAKAEALRYFEEIVPERPELALSAATLCKEEFNQDGLRRFAKVAEKYYKQGLSVAPSNTDLRIGLAQTLMLTERAEEAAKLLNDGFRLTNERRLAGMLASVLAVWENKLRREDDGAKNFFKRLQVLYAAINVSPNDTIVGQAMVKLLIDCKNSQDPAVVNLRSSILNGDALASSHFIRGVMALLGNRFDESLKHFQLASDQPNVASMMNNFAVAISETPGGNLQHALRLSEAAIEKQPDHPYFLETLGQIMVKLQRWDEAIVYLECALAAPELGPMVFPSLAKAYQEIGNVGMAKTLEQKARSLN